MDAFLGKLAAAKPTETAQERNKKAAQKHANARNAMTGFFAAIAKSQAPAKSTDASTETTDKLKAKLGTMVIKDEGPEPEMDPEQSTCLITSLPEKYQTNHRLRIDNQPDTIEDIPSKDLDEVLSMSHLLDQFVQFVPVFTLSNFMRSFPHYDYHDLPAMKEVFAIHNALTTKELKSDSFFQTTIVFKDVKKESDDSYGGYGTVKYSDTRVYNMVQLLSLFWGSFRYLECVNKMITATNSIGLVDLVRISAKTTAEQWIKNSGFSTREEKEEQDVVSAYFCLMFLNQIFPTTKDLQQGHLLNCRYTYCRVACGASRSDDSVDEDYQYAFDTADGRCTITIVTENR